MRRPRRETRQPARYPPTSRRATDPMRLWPFAGREPLDSLVMEARDRLANLGLFAAAAIVWVLVGLVVTTRDPRLDAGAGFLGAGLIGLAVGLTVAPLFWLSVFA